LIVGKQQLIQRINKNHLQRALRCGKITLAALEATLRLYRQSPAITEAIPTLKAFTRPVDEIRRMGEALLPRLQSALGKEFSVTLEDSTCQIGSGALPVEELPTVVVAVAHPAQNATRIAQRFRAATPPIIGRIRDDRFLLDLRSIFNPEDVVPKFADAKDNGS
jgi:L-seryl-tRNA(Ser) seleniumtransferase